MGSAAKSAATLGVLALIVAVWLVVGLAQATRPLPGSGTDTSAPPVCVDTQVTAGERVRASGVTVSVLNAGTRQGLAGRTMQLFVDAGFGQGTLANAPAGTTVETAQIWSSDPQSPAVRLVRSRLDGAEVVDQSDSSPGVTVVVGNGFDELTKGRRQIRATADATVCVPTVDPSQVVPTQPGDPGDPADPAGDPDAGTSG